MSRAVDEWIGKTADTPVPLAPDELGRGCHLTPERLDQMERFCSRAVREGVRQSDVVAYLGAGPARVSRWTIAGMTKYGAPTDHRLLNVRNQSVVQKIWARIEVRGANECWPWRGVIKPNGYGSFTLGSKAYNAHRLVYETLIRPIPDGLVIDHTCRNTRCVNPAHLQAVTQSANVILAKYRRQA